MRKAKLTIAILSIAVVFLSASLLISYEKPAQEIQLQENINPDFTGKKNGKSVISVPAVDSRGRGILGKFEVEAVPGSGKTLANIENLLFFVDTQFSIQTAKSVAADLTGANMSEYNIIYGIRNENKISNIVEGPSAGAALTIATIAALEEKILDPKVVITGTVLPDGTIGSVGGLESKIKAARLSGASILLIPEGQGPTASFEVKKECRNISEIKFCGTEYVKISTISESNGLVLKEVKDVSEALKYFTQ